MEDKSIILLAIISVVAITAIVFISIGVTTEISGLASKKITELPADIALLAPADGSSSTLTPTFSWTISHNADYLNLYIANDPGFSTPLVYDYQLRKSTKSYTLPSGVLESGRTYYWRIESQNTAGATDSPTYTFTTQ